MATEALTNVAKHAKATRVGLTLSYSGDVVLLDVRDDGTGIAADRGQGFGPASMTQRVRSVGGTMTVECTPGEGTAISASVRDHSAGAVTEEAADAADTDVIRVLIADDHPVVRDGLRGTFAAEPDIEVVGEAGNGARRSSVPCTARSTWYSRTCACR